ncbi:MAG: aminopeptidase [Thermoplasmata archaeon]|nr:aminopeptidase [Thermoplasmata archaeon]
MADKRAENLAKLLVNYSIDVKKGQEIIISSPPAGAPLALEVYKEVLNAGAHPMMMGQIDGATEIFFKNASDDQLKFVSPYRKYLYKNADGFVGISAAVNTRAMSGVDTKKMAIASGATAEISQMVAKRSATGEFKWVGLIYPTQAQAQEASMSLTEYEDFVYSACLADKRDPIAEWKKVKKEQAKMVKVLDKIEKLHFIGEDTDLKMSVKGRKWINCCGEKNMPDGEVFTGPVENSVEGKIRFTFPGIYMGKEVEDITLEFKKGKIVKASAEKGEDLLKSLIGVDDGAKRLGEVAIGTNHGIKKFTKSILFDEKLGGTIHMAIGMGFPETNSKNKSGIHWDIIKDMKKGGEIYGDGELIYKNGKWLK